MPTKMRTPSRRMTLGSFPSAQKSNRRQSVSNATNSVKKPARPPRGRASMIPRVGRENVVPPSPSRSERSSVTTASTAASRRRSIGGGGNERPASRRHSLLPPAAAAPVVKTDPRPITEKPFQIKCIKRLLQFLEKAGYPYPITQKSLSRPSSKDFANIVTFMLRCVDPSFQTGGMKLEDEICMNFKNIGYPFTVSKTALVAAGSPHTWPTLLAALTWLMEHLECRQADMPPDELHSERPFESLSELDTKTDKAFFQYLGESYKAFMRGDNAMTEKLENDLISRFEYDDKLLEAEIERVTDLNATLLERVQILRQEIDQYPSYTKKREDYATELEQFLDLIKQMEDHKEALLNKVDQRTDALAETNEKLDKMNQHIADLKETIKTQDLSQNDVLKLTNESKAITEAMDRLAVVKEERNHALLVSEESLAKCCLQCEAMVASYNTAVTDLARSHPEAAHWKVGQLDKEQILSARRHELLGKNIPADLNPAIQRAKAEIVEKKGATSKEYQDALDELERTTEAYKDALERKRIMEDKIAKCEESIKQEHSMHEAKLSVRQREVEAMESKVTAYSDPVALEEQIAAYERQCAELEGLQAKHQEENVAKIRAVRQEIEDACQLMVSHEEHMMGKLAELEEYRSKKQVGAGNVVLPSNLDLDN